MRARRYLAAVAGLLAATVLVGAPSAQASPSSSTTETSSTDETKSSSSESKSKKKSSWELRSEVNFSGSSLPEGCVRYSGKYAAGNSAWSEDNAVLKDGILKLKVEKKKTSKQPYTTGGMGCWNWPQTYGKFEIKAKVPAGKGINSYITLSPAKDDSANGLTSIELLAPDQSTAYISNGYGKGSEQAFSEQDFAKKFHTYTIEWAPNHLLVRLDGEEIFWSDKAFKGSRWISMATTTGDSLTGKPDASTKLPRNFEIDSMKIWKYTKVKPTPGETLSASEEGALGAAPGATGTPAPSGSAAPDAAATPGASASATDPATAIDSEPTSGTNKLTGGIWPWLIGGSVMVATAIAILSWPGRRKQKQQQQKPPPPRRQQPPPPPPPGSPGPGQRDPYTRPY